MEGQHEMIQAADAGGRIEEAGRHAGTEYRGDDGWLVRGEELSRDDFVLPRFHRCGSAAGCRNGRGSRLPLRRDRPRTGADRQANARAARVHGIAQRREQVGDQCRFSECPSMR